MFKSGGLKMSEKIKDYSPKYQEKWLPSRNLQYPKGIEVYYKPFSFGDLLKFNNSNLDEPEMYRFILEGVEVVGMDKLDLTFYDTIYLGWRRKTSSMGGNVLDAKSFCPNCDFRNVSILELDKIDFEDSDIKALPVKCKICDIELKFRFITIRDYIDLYNKDKAKDILSIYAKSVSNKDFDEAYSILNSATGNDIDKIGLLNSILYHGIKDLEVECAECKHKYNIKVADSSEVELLKPFRSKEDIIRDEISFGEE